MSASHGPRQATVLMSGLGNLFGYPFYVLVLLVALLLSSPPVRAALPTTVSVPIPSGEIVKFALPPEMCGYPPQIGKALAKFLAEGTPQLRLLGAAGDCYAIEQYFHGDTAPISPTIEIAMFENQINPDQRMTVTQYHKYCLLQYPDVGSSLLSDDIRDGMRRLDNLLSLKGEFSLGVLTESAKAVIGGEAVAISNGPRGMMSLQVVVCFAPAGVPVLWTFAGTVARSTPPEQLRLILKAAQQLAEDQAAATLDLNQ